MADDEYLRAEPERNYALSGKIMLGGVVLLFAIILFMVGLHLYARWYVVRLRRRQLEHRRGQRRMLRSQIAMYLETRIPAADRGLDRAILSSLPVFLYSPAPAPSECAVCLSEFEERETVRQLPRCGHSFHIDCIDMWFHSHSTCPLCRAPVEPVEKKPLEPEEKAEKTKPVSSSGSEPGGAGDTTTSLGARRKGLGSAGVRIEVPPRSAELDTESTQNSPAGRILALRRMLSMRRRSPATTPPGASELDLESGLSGTSRGLNRVGTPS